MSDINTGVVVSLKVLGPDGRLEKRTNSGHCNMSASCQNRTHALQQTTYELHASFDHLVGGSRAPSGHARLCFHDRLWGPGSIAGWMRGTGAGHSTRPAPMQFLPGKLSSNWPSPSPQGSRNASLDRSDLDPCRFQRRGEGWQPKRSPRRRPSGSSSSKTRSNSINKSST